MSVKYKRHFKNSNEKSTVKSLDVSDMCYVREVYLLS